MGTSTDAILAYGYDLGCGDEWKFREVGEYGEPVLDWYDDEADDTFADQAEKRLLESVGFAEEWAPDNGYWDRKKEAETRLGIKIETYCKDDYPMYVLAAKVITVSRGDVEILNLPALMDEPTEHGWDHGLRTALTVLGITPTQEQPAWVLCSYWG
ncbi:hypothetical protein [Streptosporangium sp. NPDC049078]|uniref:hypothetical protein n=1 Tax=Streptosporangium sp. NPDC049078 TaxID=3155767 RepID=UPI003439DEED